MAHRRMIVGAILVAALVAACGSSGDGQDASEEPSAGASAAAPSASLPSASEGPGASAEASEGTEPSGTDDGGAGGDFEAPTVADGAFTSGKAFVDVSGDVDLTIEADQGGGFSAGGTLIGTWTTAAGDASIQVGLNPDDASGIVMQTTKFATGGTFGEECTLDVTRNDGSGFEATFACENVVGVDVATTNSYELDLEGTLALSR